MVRSKINKKNNFNLFLLGVLIAGLSACTTGRISSDLRQRAQDVFRYHNQLVSQLILLSSDDSLSEARLIELEQAEAIMSKACKPLNQVAAKVRDGGNAGIGKRLNVPRTLNECERQTKAVEKILAEF